ANAVLRPVEGAEQVARSALDIVARIPGMTLLERTVNGRPGLVGRRDDATVVVLAFDVVDDRITRIWAVRNPDKLRSWPAGPRH
ncbi:RNA polymerase subunit sigma-24, partial [Nonomuraea sp. NPDC004297]